MKLRILAFILATLMACSVFVACSGPEEQDNTTTTEATGEGGPIGDDPAAETEYLGDLDYTDQKVHILYWTGTQNDEFNIEKTTGNSINDSIYKRDMKVQDQLNIEIVWEGIPGAKGNLSSYKQYVQTNNQDNDGSLEIITAHSMVMGAVAVDGLCRNLHDAKYIDWNAKWWPQDLINNATINDTLYFCTGDISNNLLLAMEGMFYNKGLTESNLYSYVDSYTWTIDKMIDETENMYDDIGTAPGKKDNGDKYGYATYGGMINPMFIGMGIRITTSDNENGLVLDESYVSEKSENIMKKLNGLFHVDNDWYYVGDGAFDDSADIFKEGRSLFYMASVRLTLNKLSDVSTMKYGILPAPMYNSEQKAYHTLSANTYSMYAVVSSVKDEEFDKCSAVIELLAYESYNTVTPIVFESTLKARYSDDDNDSRMFDILRETLVIELGLVYSDMIHDGIPSKGLFTLVGKNVSSWMVFMNGKIPVINQNLATINKSFD